MEVLTARLKWLREKYRFGQKEVAGEIGVTVSGYQKMEYGEANPKLESLVKIAKLYKVSTDFLLGIIDYLPHYRELLDRITALEVQRENFKDELGKILMTEDNNAMRVGLQMQSDLNFRYYKLINEYVKNILEVPLCNLEEDPFLSDYAPLVLQVNPNHINEGWNIEIIGIGKTFNHTVDSYGDKEVAVSKAEDYAARWNLDILLFG